MNPGAIQVIQRLIATLHNVQVCTVCNVATYVHTHECIDLDESFGPRFYTELIPGTRSTNNHAAKFTLK